MVSLGGLSVIVVNVDCITGAGAFVCLIIVVKVERTVLVKV